MSIDRSRMQEERAIRRWVRSILREANERGVVNEAYVPDRQAFADAFINPWMDVIKAAKVSAKELGNALSYNLATAMTFSPKKLEQIKRNYETRKKEIDAESAEVMKRVNDSLSGGDAQLIGFMMNPMAYLGTNAAFTAGEQVADFARDTGMRDVLAGMIPGLGPANWEDREKGPIGSILQDLQSIFFIAHHAPSGTLIAEGDEDGEKKDAPKTEVPKDPQEAIADLFAGTEKWFAGMADQIIDAKQQQVDEILEQLAMQLEPLGRIVESKTQEELEEALTALVASGVEVEGAGAGQFAQGIEQEVERVINDPNASKAFIEQQTEELKKSGEPVEDEEGNPIIDEERLKKDISVVIFQNSKQGLIDQVYEGLPKLKQSAIDLLEDEEIKDNLEFIESSPKGKELIDILEKAKAEIDAM